MGPTEEIAKAAAETIIQGIMSDEEPEEVADKAIKMMEDIIKELEDREEKSQEYEISLKGKIGDVLSESAVIKGNSKALSKSIKKLLHITALRLGNYDPVQATTVVLAIATEVSENLLKHAKK